MSPFAYFPLRRLILSCVAPVIVIAVLLVTVWNNPSTVYARHLRAGLNYSENHQSWQAIAEYTEAIAARPNSSDGYFYRGNSYYDLGQDRKAIADDTKALALDTIPGAIGNTSYNRGLCYERLGDNKNAIADFSTCIRLSPENGRAFLERADCYRHTENFTGTVADVTAYMQNWEPTYWAYFMRGDAYSYLKKWKESEDDLQHEVQLKPDDGFGWGVLGWSQFMCGHITQAIESDKTALSLKPHEYFVGFNLAYCFAVQNNWQKARPEYVKAIQSAKPAELKGPLEDINNGLVKAPTSSALANANNCCYRQ